MVNMIKQSKFSYQSTFTVVLCTSHTQQHLLVLHEQNYWIHFNTLSLYKAKPYETPLNGNQLALAASFNQQFPAAELLPCL